MRIVDRLVSVATLSLGFLCVALGLVEWYTLPIAVHSCAASTAATVSRLDTASFKNLELSDDWRVLATGEADELLRLARPYDCGKRFPRDGGAVRDPWSEPFKVALRWVPDEKGQRWLEVRLWSLGRDGIEGTGDDIVFPDGEAAIVQR